MQFQLRTKLYCHYVEKFESIDQNLSLCKLSFALRETKPKTFKNIWGSMGMNFSDNLFFIELISNQRFLVRKDQYFMCHAVIRKDNSFFNFENALSLGLNSKLGTRYGIFTNKLIYHFHIWEIINYPLHLNLENFTVY